VHSGTVVVLKKKKLLKYLAISCICVSLYFFFTIETTTRQGINYQTQSIRIPLYLKVFDLFERHFHYRWLVSQIVTQQMDDQQKVEAILRWTISHVANQPPQLPIIDDHVWHIIVRGYGVEDQMADVFATLTNYAGIKAFMLRCNGPAAAKPDHIIVTAVYFNNDWRLYDVYRRTMFVDKADRSASIKDIIASQWQTKAVDINGIVKKSVRYKDYFEKLNIGEFDSLYRQNRSAIQDPISRFRYFLSDRKI
jgi:hypothetical protein